MPASETAPGLPRPAFPSLLAASAVVATVAFWAFSRTLLPGVDLGDTGGFQAAAVWPLSLAREGYPLYFGLAEPFVRLASPANPARAMNLFSAVCGALACGILCAVAGRVARSAPAGAVAGLFLAFSYTFWTQSIIAEVYALHLALVAGCLAALAAFQERPTTPRLTAFLAIYAVSFGNHHMMILLIVPFAIFLVATARQPHDLLRWPIAGLTLAVAGAGALTYTGNFVASWSAFDAPASAADRLAAFWFDVTKADWRETMVFGAADARVTSRVAMWLWDARQQFGAAGLAFVALGAVRMWRVNRRFATLILLSYALSAAFALTYNVGDVHVFFLPAHLFAACAAAFAVSFNRLALTAAMTVAALGWAGWRAWDTWPAVDRHDDRRAGQVVGRLAGGVSSDEAILLTQIDWQAENALLYSSRHDRRDLAWTRLPDVRLHLPFLVLDNAAVGRDVVLTADAAAEVVAAFGTAFPLVPDDRMPALPLVETVARLPPGTPYVMTALPPTGRDGDEARAADEILAALTGAAAPARTGSLYEVWVGVTGEAPSAYRSGQRPFRGRLTLLGDPLDVRFESWLPDDTFRRPGFGRVLRGRQPLLTVERGVSLVWFRPDGSPVVGYEAGLYAVRPRYRIPAQTERFALCSKSCGSSLSY